MEVVMKPQRLIRSYKPKLLVIDIQEKLLAHMFNPSEILRNAVILIRGLQILGVPVMVFEQNPTGLGATARELIDALGTDYRPIHKMSFSIMDVPSVRDLLPVPTKDDYYILIGIESHVCLLQSALLMKEHGYTCGIVADCTGSRSQSTYIMALERLRNADIDILTTEMTLFDVLKSADNPKFKQILALVK